MYTCFNGWRFSISFIFHEKNIPSVYIYVGYADCKKYMLVHLNGHTFAALITLLDPGQYR